MLWTVFLLLLFSTSEAQEISLVSSLLSQQCLGDEVVLTCYHPDPFSDPEKFVPALVLFLENNVVLDLRVPDTRRKFRFTKVNDTTATLTFVISEEDHANQRFNCSCAVLLNDDNGGRLESNAIAMEINLPSPTNVSTPTTTSGLLKWEPGAPLCSGYEYVFVLFWIEVESGLQDKVMTSHNWYDFAGMEAGNYSVSLQSRVSNFRQLNKSPAVNTSFYLRALQPSSMPPGPPTSEVSGTSAVTVIGVVVSLLVVALGLVVVACVCFILCWKRGKRSTMPCSPESPSDKDSPYFFRQEAVESEEKKPELAALEKDPPSTPEAEGSSEVAPETQANENPPPQSDEIQYASIVFPKKMPIRPPQLFPNVTYTTTLEQFRRERKGRHVPTPPPTKSEEELEEERRLAAEEAEEQIGILKNKVVTIFQESKIVYRVLDSEEPVVGTYKEKTFVAYFVHVPNDEEVRLVDIGNVITAKKEQYTDKGILVANTDSIEGRNLEFLEKNDCHFMGLSRGSEITKEKVLKKMKFCFK